MSKVEQWLWVSPHMFVEDNPTEEQESLGHRCTVCGGMGWRWGYNEKDEDERRTCPVCEGVGLLDAHITIEWKPSVKIKQ